MNTPLETRLSALRRHIRRLLLFNGLGWLITVLVGSMAVVGVLDWVFRFDDPGVRLILSMAVLGATAFVSYRRLLAPLLVQLSDLDLALRIERLHPGLKDSLASTVQFLQKDIDPAIGSPELQRQVVQQTVEKLSNFDFDEVLQTHNVRRIIGAAIVVSLATGILVGLNRAEAAIALKRMALPLSATAWPQQTVLRVLDGDLQTVHNPETSLRIALGETVKLYIDTAKGRLPSGGMIHLRFPGDQQSSLPLTPMTVKDSDGSPHEVYVLSLMVLEGPIHFRAEAGDDREMPWFTIQAIVPPNLEELQVRITPPAYTGKPAVELPLGAGHVKALLGTNVALTARADKPLASAQLHVGRHSEDLPLSGDGLNLSVSFPITEKDSSSYWLAFRDRAGGDEGQSRHYDLHGIEDRIPSVEISEPATNLQVTPQARVPLRIVAKDDLGLRRIRLVYRTLHSDAEQAAPHVIPLYDQQNLPQHETANYELDLAPLKLKTGNSVVLHAEATDAYDLGAEHIGRSLPRTLTVITVEEKKRELADRQADIMNELEAVQKRQDTAHEQVRQLQIQLSESGELLPQDLDILQRAEMTQRQVTKQLTDKDRGIRQRTKRLLDDLHNNNIADPETAGRMSKLGEEIGRLSRENLPKIEEELTATRKRVQAEERQPNGAEESQQQKQTAAPDSGDEKQRALGVAAEHQQIVLESLTEVLKEMSQWRTHRDLARDLDEVIEGQQQLNSDTETIGGKTLTKALPELTPQEKADLKRLADRQRQSAKRLDQLQSKIDQTLKSRGDQDSTESQLLQDVADQMREQATTGQMREAARQLQQNDTGAAGQTQQQLLRQLRDLHDTFRNRRETDTAALIKKLKKAEQELSRLKDKQQELLRKINKARQISDKEQRRQELQKLKKQQQQLREEAAKMSRRLRRLQIRKAQNSTARAAQRLQKAERNLDEDDPAAAEQQAQEAIDDLEQAQRELAQQRRQAEEKLAQEQLEKIADELQAMIPRQQGVIDETRRLEGIHQEKGKWTRATLRTLGGLADVQSGLREETEQLIETLSAAEVFALALKGAARDMDRAAELLSRRKTGARTLRHEERAKQRFIDLIAALNPDKKQQKQQQQQQQNPAPGGQQAAPPVDGIPNLAQLKLLKIMQQDLMERTAEISERMQQDDDLTAEGRQELQDLAIEQSELADLARNLTKLATAATQNDEAPPQNAEEADE